MKTLKLSYRYHRVPSEIISHAIWRYHRFCLSFREVEELLAERGGTVTYETVRRWCQKFGPDYARKLKKHLGRLGDGIGQSIRTAMSLICWGSIGATSARPDASSAAYSKAKVGSPAG